MEKHKSNIEAQTLPVFEEFTPIQSFTQKRVIKKVKPASLRKKQNKMMEIEGNTDELMQDEEEEGELNGQGLEYRRQSVGAPNLQYQLNAQTITNDAEKNAYSQQSTFKTLVCGRS